MKDFFAVAFGPALLLSFVYFIVAPRLVFGTDAIFASIGNKYPSLHKLFAREQSKEITATTFDKIKNLLMFFSILIFMVVVVGKNFNNAFLVFVMTVNVSLAMFGAYAISVRTKISSLITLVPLAVLFLMNIVANTETNWFVMFNVITFLALIGGYVLLRISFSVSTMKLFLIIFTIMDIIMVSTGTLSSVFPFAAFNSDQHLFNFFYMPNGLKIGAGDFLGLLFLATVALVERSNYKLVFLTYLVVMLGSLLLITNGVVSIFPATIPLLPALLVAQLTRNPIEEEAIAPNQLSNASIDPPTN